MGAQGIFGQRRSNVSLANSLKASWSHPTENTVRSGFRRCRSQVGLSNRRAPGVNRHPFEQESEPDFVAERKRKTAANAFLRTQSEASLKLARGKRPASVKDSSWKPRKKVDRSVFQTTSSSITKTNASLAKRKSLDERPKNKPNDFGGYAGYSTRMEAAAALKKVMADAEPRPPTPPEEPLEDTPQGSPRPYEKILSLKSIVPRAGGQALDDHVYPLLEGAIYDKISPSKIFKTTQNLQDADKSHLQPTKLLEAKNNGYEVARLKRVRGHRERIQNYITGLERFHHMRNLGRLQGKYSIRDRYDKWVRQKQHKEVKFMYTDRRLSLGSFSPLSQPFSKKTRIYG